MAHIEIENLTFRYPAGAKNALDGVSLSIGAGEYVCLCGLSGSGKTTLMRHLKPALTPHGARSGSVTLDGRRLDALDLREQSSRIGYVMQNPDSQLVTDKVWHELAFGLESLGCDQRTMRLRVAEMASYFGIQNWFHRPVAELSGGQKQLLNLASVMAMQPEVLILDEPTSQLDPIAAADFLNTIAKINRELGTTVILSEHRLEDALPAADRVVVLEDGRVAADAPPREIGALLAARDSEMLPSLPAPVRIYLQSGSRQACPLTVREGRGWLSRELEGVRVRSAGEDEPPYAEPDEPALALDELWLRYEKQAPDVLRGTSLKVARGTLHAVVGGNGSGKSTMLKAICGLARPYRGRVFIEGKRLEKYRDAELFEGCIAMLPQDPQSLFVKKTVRGELEEMTDGRLPPAEREAQIAEAAQLCRIGDILDSHPYDLSGGEQQRAALAKVLLCRPRILLLDEPTKGMDNAFKNAFAALLGRLKARGVTILMVSHDVEFCASWADAVSMFFDGGVVTTNTPRRFFARNSFYTTAANRMSRHCLPDAVTAEDVVCALRAAREESHG